MSLSFALHLICYTFFYCLSNCSCICTLWSGHNLENLLSSPQLPSLCFQNCDVAQFAIIHRVDQLVTEHLNAQGKPNPRQGLCCFWCPNKTWTLPLRTFDTLTIIINRLTMRKRKKGQSFKKQTTKHYKGWFTNT
jgi:hypothetical protein